MGSEAFVFRVEKITPYLKSFAISLTHDYVNSQDLIQETVLKAFKNLHRFNDGTNFSAWMSTIMKNIFINDYRKKARQNTVSAGDNAALTYAMENKNTTKNFGPHNIDHQLLTETVHTLKPELKQPFLLYFEGYKYDEIAEQLNIPLGTVKSRIFNARKLLKTKLTKLGITL